MKNLIAIALLASSLTAMAQIVIPPAEEPAVRTVSTKRVLLDLSASRAVLSEARALIGRDISAADNVQISLLGSGTGASCRAFVITGLPANPMSITLPMSGEDFTPSKLTTFVHAILPYVTLADWTSSRISYYGIRLIHRGPNTGQIEVSAGYDK